MELSFQILVIILSVFLALFLMFGIILLVRLIMITKEVKKIVITGQRIAEDAENVVENVKGLTSVGGIVGTFVDKYKKKHNK